MLFLVVALVGQEETQEPPAPPPSAAGTIAPLAEAPQTRRDAGTEGSSDPQVGGAKQHPLPVSEPQLIDIPAIDVSSAVFAVGKDANGTIAVPQPGPDLNKAAWYESSVTPGQPGPSVIIGHVDTTEGPSIFWRLGDLRPGDAVSVTREDGNVAKFTVDGVRDYPDRNDFPTALVYGGDLSRSTTRIVTCTNFDTETRTYLGNTVVFAHLTDVDKPQT